MTDEELAKFIVDCFNEAIAESKDRDDLKNEFLNAELDSSFYNHPLSDNEKRLLALVNVNHNVSVNVLVKIIIGLKRRGFFTE